jgi:hypothetical protein
MARTAGRNVEARLDPRTRARTDPTARMSPMSSPAVLRPPGFSRRTLLAASAAGVALLVAGCTSSPDERETVTSEQADELAAQLAVQEALVAAYDAASGADPALGAAVAALAAQAAAQLERLRLAAPNSAPPAASSSAAPAGPEAKAWLRARISAAATSHATACLDQSGARAALLGSIAAGLRGQDGLLA